VSQAFGGVLIFGGTGSSGAGQAGIIAATIPSIGPASRVGRTLLCSGPQVKAQVKARVHARPTRRRSQPFATAREEPRMKKLHRFRMTGLLTGFVCAMMMLSGAPLRADSYPSKPITMIVPFGPGSATDTVARVIAQPLGTALKQNIVVENKPGANGALAALYVARSAPDGYTLFLSTNSPHSAAPFLMKNVSYDVVNDFAAVSRVGSYTLMLVTHPSIPAKSVKELIAHAKANPGKLTFASGNTSGVVAGETLKHWACCMFLTRARRRPFRTCSRGACR
jgi:hypothetical protein